METVKVLLNIKKKKISFIAAVIFLAQAVHHPDVTQRRPGTSKNWRAKSRVASSSRGNAQKEFHFHPQSLLSLFIVGGAVKRGSGGSGNENEKSLFRIAPYINISYCCAKNLSLENSAYVQPRSQGPGNEVVLVSILRTKSTSFFSSVCLFFCLL